jgi:SAM-dependent methyltransferase
MARSGQGSTVPDRRVTWYLPTGSGDRWPVDYERGRPGWPPEVVDLPRVPSAATVLDLAAGTGKLTRLLVPAFSRVVAVEPQDAMRRVLQTLCPEAEAHGGTAEEIPLADASIDAVFVAQAFHWFDNERALAEIARVLRPRGALVVMWNLPASPWEPSIATVEQMLLQRAPDEAEPGCDPLDLHSPRYKSGAWRLAFRASLFGELHEARLPNPQTLDRDGLVAFLASMGWIADFPDVDRLTLLEEVKSLLDAEGYRRLWETHVHWTRLSDRQGTGDSRKN